MQAIEKSRFVISISVVSTLVTIPINDEISMLQWRDQSYLEKVYTNWSVEIVEA
jgi:hypothetical protein